MEPQPISCESSLLIDKQPSSIRRPVGAPPVYSTPGADKGWRKAGFTEGWSIEVDPLTGATSNIIWGGNY